MVENPAGRRPLEILVRGLQLIIFISQAKVVPLRVVRTYQSKTRPNDKRQLPGIIVHFI